jgi:hypothetical protein
MRHYSSLLVVIILIVAIIAPVTGRTPHKQFGKIKVRVVDVNNARIVRAHVLVLGQNLELREVTNVDGEAEILVPPGDFWLSIEAEGFRRFDTQKFQIKSGKTERFNIKMQIKAPEMLVPAVSDPNLISND